MIFVSGQNFFSNENRTQHFETILYSVIVEKRWFDETFHLSVNCIRYADWNDI